MSEQPAGFHTIADRLDRVYGSPTRHPLPLGNKHDPLDELVYIMLTVMTQYGVDGVYTALRSRFRGWADVLRSTEAELATILQPLGLSKQRARRIRAMLAVIEEREGAVDLRRLDRFNDAEIEAYLTGLPGVGKKVARCVMLYSLGRDVFPVDAHVLRVLTRLGIAAPELGLQAAQDELQSRVPDLIRYTLHVNLVVHGRTICKARKPACERCVLRRRCEYARGKS